MKLAVLDVGSNSFHLVVVEVGADGELRLIERAKEMVRIGEGTLRTKVIPTDGFERGIDALVRLRMIAERHQPEALLAVATAAIREATNGDTFVRGAREEAGVDLRVIDAAEEARLTYLGARGALALGTRRAALFDLGGGSLEIIVADAHDIHFVTSLPLGGLRLAEVWLEGDPPRPDRLGEMRTAIRRALEPPMAEVAAVGYDFVALLAGTANTVRAILAARATGAPPPTDVNLSTLSTLEDELAALPAAKRARVAGLEPRRADTIVPGVAVLRTVVELSGRDHATFSSGGIRDGIVIDYLSRR